MLQMHGEVGNAAVTQLVQRSEAEAEAGSRETVRFGSSGPAVVALQQGLNGAGAAKPPLATDGKFGQATLKATRTFQRAAGLSSDGIVGPQTWGAVDAGVKVATSTPANPKIAAVGTKIAAINALVKSAQPRMNKAVGAVEKMEPAPTEPVERAAPAPPQDLFDDAADWLGDTAGDVVDTVSDVAGDVVDTVSDVAGDVVDTVSDVAGDVVDTVSDAASAVGGAVSDAADWATETAAEVVTGLSDAASGVADSITEMGEEIGQAFADEWQRLSDIASAIASGASLDEILAMLQGVYDDLKKKIAGFLGDEESEEEDAGEDIHGTLPGVRYTCMATASDSTEGHVKYSSNSGRGAVNFEGGEFGRNQPELEVTGEYTIYRGRDGVRIDADVKLHNKWGVQGAGKEEINGSNDPKVTSSTWDKIADDLDPAAGEGYPGSPPREKYWVPAITVAHEQFHEGEILRFAAAEAASEDTKRMINGRYIEVSDLWRFERWLGMDPGEEENVKKRMNGFLGDIGEHMVKVLESKTTGWSAEARAYRAGRGDYEKLVAEIRERARKNNWPKNK